MMRPRNPGASPHQPLAAADGAALPASDASWPDSGFAVTGTVPGRARLRRRPSAAVGGMVLVAAMTTGCAAAVGAVAAAQQLQAGIAGVQALVAGSRSLRPEEAEVVQDLSSPLAGTYRAEQVLGDDTLRYYVRTVERPTAPIISDSGVVRGYALAGIAATTLDTLEARVGAGAGTTEESDGRAIFFVEGTQAPDPHARTLYPAAFLGQVAEGESEAADRQATALQLLEIEMDAPELDELQGQAIPHELFGSVAEGIFSLTPQGAAAYEQETELEDGRVLSLRLERISATTLPIDRNAEPIDR